MLHGKRNHGKSQLALTLCKAVVEGAPFLGVYPTAQGDVVFLQVDNPPMVQQERVRMLQGQFGDGWDAGRMHWLLNDRKIDVIDELQQASTPAWSKKVQEIEPKLVVIDSLRKTHRLDENDNSTPSEVYEAFRILCGPSPTLFFLHHDRKTMPIRPGQEAPPQDEMGRGAQAWIDDADTGMHIKKVKRGSGYEFLLYWTKLRTSGELPMMRCTMNTKSLLIEPRDDAESYLAAAMAAGLNRTEILERVQALGMPRTTAFRKLAEYKTPVVPTFFEKGDF